MVIPFMCTEAPGSPGIPNAASMKTKLTSHGRRRRVGYYPDRAAANLSEFVVANVDFLSELLLAKPRIGRQCRKHHPAPVVYRQAGRLTLLGQVGRELLRSVVGHRGTTGLDRLRKVRPSLDRKFIRQAIFDKVGLNAVLVIWMPSLRRSDKELQNRRIARYHTRMYPSLTEKAVMIKVRMEGLPISRS